MNTNSIELTVGIDLGDKKVSVCVLDIEGTTIEQKMVMNTKAHLEIYFDKFTDPSKVMIAMEAGSHSPWISHFLKSKGFNVVVGNARKLRCIWQSDSKDDDKDAEMLARICRFDRKLFYPIEHRSPTAQSHLSIIKARDALTKSRTDLVNTVRGLAKTSGYKLPTCSTPSFPAKVAPEIPEELRPALNPLLDTISSLSATIKLYDKCIKALSASHYKETTILQQVVGVGPITALSFILTLEDANRFSSCRAVGPFLGLVPKRDQSGTIDKPLSITKAGNVYLRKLLVGAANYILGPFGPDCELRRYGLRIASRGGKVAKRKAKVAVARKLAILLLSLWKENGQYDPFYQKTQKQNKRAA